MHEPVQYLQKLLEKAAAHQKKEKLSDSLLKLSGVNVQVPHKPSVSTQQQLGSVDALTSEPLTNGPITQSKAITQTLDTKPTASTGTNQSHIASSNPMRGSSTPKANSFTPTTKIPNILKTAQGTPPIVPPAAPKPKGGTLSTGAVNPSQQPGAAGVVDFPHSSQTRGAQPIPTYSATPPVAAPVAPVKPRSGGTIYTGGNEYRQTPYSTAEINASNTVANTPTQPGAAGVVDFPQTRSRSATNYANNSQVKDLPTTLPNAQFMLKPVGRTANAAGALYSASQGNYLDAIKSIAKKELPGVSAVSHAQEFASRIANKDIPGALLEGAATAVPIIPDALQWARDNAKNVDIQAERNNRFNQRSREVQGSLKEYRNTGLEDVDGNPYINTNDVALLGKLGFDFSVGEYLGLEKTSEVLDVYSYIEKVAGVPKEVAKLIDAGQAFSGEYLKDMGYKLPKGYEVKGDLCCPLEKKAEEPLAPNFLKLSNGTVIDLNNLSYMLRHYSQDYHTVVSPKHIEGEPHISHGQSSFTNEGHGWGGYGSPKINKSPQYTYIDDSGKKVGVTTGYHRPEDPYLRDIVKTQIRHRFNYHSPNAEKIDLPETFAKEIYDHLGGDDWFKLHHKGNKASHVSEMNELLKQKGFGYGITDQPKLVFDKYMRKVREEIDSSCDADWTNKPIGGPPSTLLQKLKPYRKAIGIGAGVTGLGALAYHLYNKNKGQSAQPISDVEKTGQSFQQTEKEEKESSEKTAAADPAQTILITGHSGSGKTTLSRQLAEKLGIPVRRVDAHRGWDNYIRGDDKRWKETLTPGTKEHGYFTNLVNRATRDTLKNAPAAGIIEGTQLGHLSPEELAKFKAHIVAGGTRDQSIAQRIQRSVDKASKQGVTFSPEEMAAKKIKAEYVANFWEPGVEKFRKLPGVLNYNHSEHQIDPLVEQLKHLMEKEALEFTEASTPDTKAVKLLANTVGIVPGLIPAMAMGQEKALDFYKQPDLEEVKARFAKIKDDPRLANVKVRLGYSDPVDDIRGIFARDDINLPGKIFRSGVGAVTSLGAAAARGSHYNPFTNNISVYGSSPEVMAHEIGHALDFNRSEDEKVDRVLGRPVLDKLLPGLIGTQILESAANTEAEKIYEGDPRELRRRLWPARSTYLLAGALGLGEFGKEINKSNPAIGQYVSGKFPGITKKVQELLGKGQGAHKSLLQSLTKDLRLTNTTAKTLAFAAAAGLLGRAGAETRNLFDSYTPPEDSSDIKKAAGRCWEGYEPVPGKEPYSNDSCKPVAKKKESELKKEAADSNELRKLILAAYKGSQSSKQSLSAMGSKGGPRKPRSLPKPSTPATDLHKERHQGIFPFLGSHQAEIAKNTIDPTYVMDPSKYLGKQAEEEDPLIDTAKLKRKFKYWATKMRDHGVMAGTYHKRIAIPKKRLSEDNLKQLGFEPVAIAIPEAGQDQFASYRNPNNLFHLHSHGDHWTMHEDEHPSLTMALRNAPIEEVPAAIVSGLSHITTEGLPGAYKYISNRLTGSGSMLDAVMNESVQQKNKLPEPIQT